MLNHPNHLRGSAVFGIVTPMAAEITTVGNLKAAREGRSVALLSELTGASSSAPRLIGSSSARSGWPTRLSGVFAAEGRIWAPWTWHAKGAAPTLIPAKPHC